MNDATREDRPSRVEAGSVELRRIELQLRQPHVAAHGTVTHRRVLLCRWRHHGVDGWGECVAFEEPGYTPEFIDSAEMAIRRFLLPALARAASEFDPDRGAGGFESSLQALHAQWRGVRGHHMAKAAVEQMALDWLASAARCDPLGWIGPPTSPAAGAVIGVGADLATTTAAAETALADGYRRVKVKIDPGSVTTAAVALRGLRRTHPDLIELAADANGSFQLEQAPLLTPLDDLGLSFLEQPLAPSRLVDHAVLSERLSTPLCLDESIDDLGGAAAANALSAATMLCLKPARLGGLIPAVEVANFCAEAGLAAWVGGMLETGIGRRFAMGLCRHAACTGATDLGPNDAYFETDTAPGYVLANGRIEPVAGVEFTGGFGPINAEAVAAATRAVSEVPVIG